MQDIREEPRASDEHHRGRLRSFARRHPALTVIGAAGLGLLAGPELAAGILAGAGIGMLLRRQGGREAREPTQTMRAVRERARAVVDAALGKAAAPASPRTEQPRTPDA
jgi:hypothetical protein